MNEKDYWIIEAMRKFGGGFVRALAEAASQADPENLSKIKSTWAKYWEDYEDRGRKLRDEYGDEGV